MFRWLAGFSCLFFVLVAITSAFPGLLGFNDEPSFAMALSLLSGAVCFASIAASGRLPSGAKQRLQLHLCATKYSNGNMTLDEYGATTKEILNEN
jgi:hypothetical protein